MIGPFHLEPALAIAYAILLMAIAVGLEWVAKHAHKRSDQYHTGGFRFHRDRDAWECPVGLVLIRAEIDHEKGMVRYRAPAHTCNSCQIKSRCTNSDTGREIEVPIDPWVQSAALRLQRGISLVLVTLAAVIAIIELFRHNHGPERWILGLLLLFILKRLLTLASRAAADRGGYTLNPGAPWNRSGSYIGASGRRDNSYSLRTFWAATLCE